MAHGRCPNVWYNQILKYLISIIAFVNIKIKINVHLENISHLVAVRSFINIVKVENSCCGSQAAHTISKSIQMFHLNSEPGYVTMQFEIYIKQKLRFPLRHIKMIWIKKCKRAFNFNLCLFRFVSIHCFECSLSPVFISLCHLNECAHKSMGFPSLSNRHSFPHSNEVTSILSSVLGPRLFVRSSYPITSRIQPNDTWRCNCSFW